MTMQRVKQVQGLSFCCDIAPRSCCSLLTVWIEGGWIFLEVWAQDVQTRGSERALASGPASSQREAKHVFSFHVPEAAGQSGWTADPFVSSLRACGGGDETREGPEEAEMGTALGGLTAAGHQGRGGSGGGGRDVEGKARARRSCRLPALFPSACLLLSSECPTPQKPKPAPKAMKISACLMKSNSFIFRRAQYVGRARQQRTDIRPIGRTRSLKSCGTSSFRTGTETDKDIEKEKFGVAYYKTESLKNLRTFGSTSYLVNRTHIYSCIF